MYPVGSGLVHTYWVNDETASTNKLYWRKKTIMSLFFINFINLSIVLLYNDPSFSLLKIMYKKLNDKSPYK